jgi:hypothetical protein
VAVSSTCRRSSKLIRSFALIAAACALLWFYFNKKIKEMVFISVLGLLILGDLWQVDKRYLNDSDFEKKKAAALFEKSPVDEEILKDYGYSFACSQTR